MLGEYVDAIDKNNELYKLTMQNIKKKFPEIEKAFTLK